MCCKCYSIAAITVLSGVMPLQAFFYQVQLEAQNEEDETYRLPDLTFADVLT